MSKWDVPEGAPGADMAVTYREAVAAGTLLQPGESRPSMLNPVDAAKQARASSPRARRELATPASVVSPGATMYGAPAAALSP